MLCAFFIEMAMQMNAITSSREQSLDFGVRVLLMPRLLVVVRTYLATIDTTF